MTPLLGADGETYAVAQGNLLVGGLGVAGNDGSSLIVNVPTVGRIPGGATVEQLIETDFLTTDNLILNLHQGDFSITNQVAEAVNDVFGNGVAVALDSRSVKVHAPVDPAQKVSFISMLENIEIEPERQSAKVVVNARTGTIVIGGDVRVTRQRLLMARLLFALMKTTLSLKKIIWLSLTGWQPPHPDQPRLPLIPTFKLISSQHVLFCLIRVLSFQPLLKQ